MCRQSFLIAGAASGRMDRMFKKSAWRWRRRRGAGGVVVTGARRVQLEQLGDLKLYRVPDRTTVASRQSKQVRLLDRLGIPVARVYGADLRADIDDAPEQADLAAADPEQQANHLGLPLPSGRVAVFAARDGREIIAARVGPARLGGR